MMRDTVQPSPFEQLVRAFPVMIFCLYVAFGGFVASNIHHNLDPRGSPLGYDFSAFYEAAQFAKNGHAVDAYDDGAMIAAERSSFPGNTTRLPWNYPPTFQLLLTPLAALPYVAAWVLWSVGLYAAYAVLARAIVPPQRLWLMLLFPGAAINLLVGQNGLLSTVLIGGGVLLLDRRPWIAGVMFGLMAYKPHLAILIPLVLLCGRAWRALAATIISGIAFVALSAAILGTAPWQAFIDKTLNAPAIFQSSSSDWHSIPSILILARSLGLSGGVSAALHWIVAASAAIGAMWVWRQTNDARLRAAALAAGTLLVSPYLRIYDLAPLILPIVALARGERGRPKIAEWILVAVAWVMPAVLLFGPAWIQGGPLVIAALMGVILWRTSEISFQRQL